MAENQEAANFYRGLMVIGLFVGTLLAVGSLGASMGWAVGLASAAASCLAWSLVFWLAARLLEKDGGKNAG